MDRADVKKRQRIMVERVARERSRTGGVGKMGAKSGRGGKRI